MVAEHGSVGRAADALGLSATALSKSLRRLEKSVGAKLIQRTPKGVELTAVGKALIVRAGKLQLALDDIRHEAADIGAGRVGHVKVGVNSGVSEYLIANAYVTLRRESPNVSLGASVMSSTRIMPALQSGLVDFIVCAVRRPMPSNLACEQLFSDFRVVYGAASHPLAGRKRVTLADLAKEHGHQI